MVRFTSPNDQNVQIPGAGMPVVLGTADFRVETRLDAEGQGRNSVLINTNCGDRSHFRPEPSKWLKRTLFSCFM